MIYKYIVYRASKPPCKVMICKDRATNKYCFVNLTSGHVCKCRFNTIEAAVQDMEVREDVTYFYRVYD